VAFTQDLPLQIAVNGESLTLSVTAIAISETITNTLTYQWRKLEAGSAISNDIPGATSNTLVLSGLTSENDNGDKYFCTVREWEVNFQLFYSVATTLSVPSESIFVLSSNTNASGLYLLESSFINDRPSYRKDANTVIYWDSSSRQWVLFGYNSDNTIGLLFHRGPDINNTPLPPRGSWAYGVVWARITDPAVITINSHPSNQTISPFGTATFSVSAVVASDLNILPSYQWQQQNGGTGEFANISGANSNTLILNLVSPNNNGNKYRCLVTATTGATPVASNPATLTVSVGETITISDYPDLSPGNYDINGIYVRISNFYDFDYTGCLGSPGPTAVYAKDRISSGSGIIYLLCNRETQFNGWIITSSTVNLPTGNSETFQYPLAHFNPSITFDPCEYKESNSVTIMPQGTWLLSDVQGLTGNYSVTVL
jgi:hypothetical protein